jgi:16S rRNA (cytidine1402-2'-O)-methyltransferase
MQGTLALCGTPIGNLSDISERLAQTLRAADVIYAEDTRRAGKLLHHLGISKPVRSMFAGNETSRSAEIGERLAAGEFVAVVTDAGMPVISDPGASAVRSAVTVGATITVIPGPSAVSAALAASGFSGDRYVFEGFLPRKGKERTERLSRLVGDDRTAVFFASPRRLGKDLGDLAASLGEDRRVVVAREITKLFEEFWRGSLAEARDHWSSVDVKGECTVVVEGRPDGPPSIDDALLVVERMVGEGTRLADAVREAAGITGVRRNILYEAALRRNDS